MIHPKNWCVQHHKLGGWKIENHVMWINRKNAGGHILITSCKRRRNFFLLSAIYIYKTDENMKYSVRFVQSLSVVNGRTMQTDPQNAAHTHIGAIVCVIVIVKRLVYKAV